MTMGDLRKLTLRTDEAHFDQITVLDGSSYLLRFDYHESWDRWTLGVFTVSGDPIVEGLTITANSVMGHRVTDPRFWPGDMLALSSTEQDPGWKEIAKAGDFVLAYVEAG